MELVLIICLVTAVVTGNDVTTENHREPVTCRSLGKCYNRFWCDTVLSARNCSRGLLNRKIECLADLLDNRTQTCQWLKESSEIIDDLTKNLSVTQKNVEKLEKELNELSLADKETTTSLSDLRTKQEEFIALSVKLNAFDKTMNKLQEHTNKHGTEINQYKQDKLGLDGKIESLQTGISSASEEINLLRSTFEQKRKEFEAQKSEVDSRFIELNSSVEKRLQEMFSKGNDSVTQELEILKQKLTDKDNQLTLTLISVNETVVNNIDNFTSALSNLSEEMHDRFDDIKSQNIAVDNKINETKIKLESDISVKTQSVLRESKAEIDAKANEINKKVIDLSNSVDVKVERIHFDLKQMTDSFKETKTTLESKINDKAKQLHSDIDDKAKSFEKRLGQMSANTATNIESIRSEVLEIGKSIGGLKTDVDQNLSDIKGSLNKKIQEEIEKVDSKVDHEVLEMKKSIEELKKDIGQLIKIEVDKLAEQTIAVNNTVTKQKEIVDIIYPNTFNKEMFIIAFLVLVVLLGINFCIVYILVKRTSPAKREVREQTTESVHPPAHSGEEPHSPVEVLNRLTFKSLPIDMSLTLGNYISVVSFYEEAQKHHRRLIKSVQECMEHNVKVQYHVIRRHEHIPGIPRGKLCIMFVEFSERHVIIEEPGLGLGDLKRKTAKFINDMRACLVIVYVKDPGSRHLKSSELFNKSIYCVKSQPELTPLSKSGRFLSIYDNFTEDQTKRLIDIITAKLTASSAHTGAGNRPNLRLDLN